MKKISITILIIITELTTLNAQKILNPNVALKAFYNNFDKIKFGTFELIRTETVASSYPKTYKSIVEFDATSISSDSVVRHLISIGDSEQVYYYHDTLYHLFHLSKQCFIRPAAKINCVIALGYERLYDFMPYVSKKNANRFYEDKTWVLERFNDYRFNEVMYDSLYSYIRYYIVKDNKEYSSGFAFDMKLNAALSQVVSCTYTNISNYFTKTTAITLTPIKEGLNQLNTFDISYYLEHYKVEITMPDKYFHKN
jgi:hypothetical protein